MPCQTPLSAQGADSQSRPNILWIVAEDMSRNLGCYGDDYAKTPHLDALAARGVLYSRFFAESPMCSPSRSTIITGMHNGPLGTSQMRSNHLVPDFVEPFTRYLRDAGYYCTNNVKTDYNLSSDGSGTEHSFVARAWDACSRNAHWRDAPADRPFFCVLNFMDTHQSRTSRNEWEYFVNQVQSHLKPDQIHDPADAVVPPHYPDSKLSRRTIARYYDCVSALDDFVGKQLAELKASNRADNTIVFFYSDHGAGLPTGKGVASSFGLRVPLIVSMPDSLDAMVQVAPPRKNDTLRMSNRLTCFADLAPTMLAVAGVRVPSYMHGTPFLATSAEAPAFVWGTRDRMDETLETTRWVTDGRFMLVRSYRTDVPVDQQTLTSRYNAKGELCQEIRELKKAGQLTPVQEHFWGDRRPGVTLYDQELDPWNLNDLSTDPSYAAHRVQLLEELEFELWGEPDLGFWTEPDLTNAEQQGTAYDQTSIEQFPLADVLDIMRTGSESDWVHALQDECLIVRYWALESLIGKGDKTIRSHFSSIQSLMDDPSDGVRVRAAGAIARLTGDRRALNLLADAMLSDNQWTACRAARMLQEAGSQSRPVLESMRSALALRSAGFEDGVRGSRPVHTGLQFALEAAIEDLDAMVEAAP
ncbi:MAG: sulfatase-like hydrolase/transferase [Planctomycetota bacterium]